MPLSREDHLTTLLSRRLSGRGMNLLGDDAAFLPDNRTAVTLDQQISGVHFPADLEPETVGRRLVAVNVSDIAAVGARPTFAFLGVAAPREYPVHRLLASVEEALADADAVLAGGDLAAGQGISTTLTLLGRRHRWGRWVRRSSARAGDRLWTGGTLGESALGRRLLSSGARYRRGRVQLPSSLGVSRALQRAARRAVRRHLRPPDQIPLGAWLSRRRRAAAIDVSDGLLLDAERLCRASGVGALIEFKKLPTVARFSRLAELVDSAPSEMVLAGGEDYVLLFSLPAGIKPPEELGATEIGLVRKEPGVEVVGAALPAFHGWDHFDTS